MGCDIQAHIDIDGSHFAQFNNIARDYTLFHGLAGVRSGKLNQIFPLRGLPTEISWQTQADYEEYGADAHSASWLTTEELNEVFRQYIESIGKEHTDIEAILGAMNILEKSNPKKVLFIFWFDN